MNQKNYYKKYRKPFLFIGLLLVTLGIFTYNKMQTALFPEVMFPKVKLIADVGSTPIDRMMVTVTKPIESAVKRVKGVTVVKSVTSRGSSDVQIYFNWGVDVDNAKLQIESRLNEIKNLLPTGTNIAVEGYNQSLFPVYGFTLESENEEVGLIGLRDLAMNTVRPLFSQIEGISTVILRGGKAKEFEIVPDVIKMSSYGVKPDDLIQLFKQNNYVLSNGKISDFRRLYLTLTDNRINDAEELANVVVKNTPQRLVRLRDFAKIELQQQTEFNIINANGHQGVIVDLVKQPGVNLVQFADAADAKAAEITKLLPKGIKLRPYYNQSAFVNESINSVVHTILEGLLLAIIVVIIFLRSWRASTVVILTLPVILGFTLIALGISGITINVMSLGGIAAAVGLFIDDIIVIIEQIYRGHEDHPEKDKFEIVRDAIKDLFPAMVGSSLSTIVIFLPFVLMGGLAGAFFKELAKTMELTLVCSFFATWIVTPVLHLIIGYRPHKHSHAHSEEESLNKYKWLTNLYRLPWLAVVFICVLIIGGWFASGKLQTGFLPELDEGTIVMDYYSPSGTAIEETDKLCQDMEKIILKNPDVESYSRRTGLRLDFRNVAPNYGDYLIQLKKNRKYKTSEIINELRRDIQSSVPAMTIEFGQRIQDLLGNLMSTPSPIEVKIFGDDQRQLEFIGRKADSIMRHTKGLVDVSNGMISAGPSVIIYPDDAKLAQYGVSLSDFQNQLRMYTEGIVLGDNANVTEPSPVQASMLGNLQVGQIQDGEQMRKIRLRVTNYQDNDMDKIKKQMVFLPDGALKPLSFFCTVKSEKGEIDYKREDLKSCVVLTSRLSERDLGSAVNELKGSFAKLLNLPPGYYVNFGGAYAEQQQSFKELLTILAAACLLVFTVLLFLFREWVLSFLILGISILGIPGCLFALYVTHIPLNVSSYTGIIMIVGIIAENAIFTVNQFRYNMHISGGDVNKSVNYALALRIRPKLMTAIGAILALMPLALGIGMGAQMQQALAIAVIGGFVTGIPLLLFVFPTFIRIIYSRKKNKQEL
ncbi:MULTISPECIES: efflux RND transporter permease subunit [Bacteroidota]|uniref:efflux RND transporter permease subunit n=1 Tax=Bacteroidota TaxID=976 RepID=UPI000B48D4C1|nr:MULTISPECIES: efflux RND transporter permease subunit [Bacteroidota]MCW2258636.1 CzcA family heavy metal efflux pump [Sphingobacterium kitahiroshimense]MDE5470561.1 efflux RND transporter permease subunit [Elizabethkingia meningoseptica]MDE5492712.1 efflux RND transporter permease subunit [Elizabethkingia meningoseptica]TCR14907.1 CzcA family heavy metal efflux pump [Sphingobacterium sp. JUb78]